MPPQLSRVSCTGPALAALLQAMAVRKGDFDGFILGSTVLRKEATWHDDREEEAQERLEACISAFACFEAACSFYSPAGEVSVPQLTDLVRALALPAGGAHRVLGWFVRRSGTWLVPSVRDRAVCAALPGLLALLSPGQAQHACPLLFAVVADGTEHSGATLSFQQRWFQAGAHDQPLSLHQIALVVANLGSSPGAPPAYPPLHPVAGLPTVAVPCAAQPCNASDLSATDGWAAEEEFASTSGRRQQKRTEAGGGSAAHAPGAWPSAASLGDAAERGAGSGAGTGDDGGWETHLSRLAGGAACGAVAELERVYAAMAAALAAEEQKAQASAHATAALRADVARLAASP